MSLWDRDEALLSRAQADLSAGGEVSIEVVDVASAGSVRKGTTSALEKHGRIDILVANAGIAGPNLKSWEYPLDAWKQVIDINLTGVFLCCGAIIHEVTGKRNSAQEHCGQLHYSRSRAYSPVRANESGAH